VLAKEAVVGTLDALYSQMAENTVNKTDKAFELSQALLDAVQTVPENLKSVADKLLDPFGVSIGNVVDQQLAAEEQEVKVATFNVMQRYFDGRIGAFAYLLFILLYAPCVAATAAIYRETTAGWAIFVAGWTTLVAYVTATLFYQMMTFAEHPETSRMWGLFVLTIFSCVLWALRYFGEHHSKGATV
jgi:ferrous iron transport protein B